MSCPWHLGAGARPPTPSLATLSCDRGAGGRWLGPCPRLTRPGSAVPAELAGHPLWARLCSRLRATVGTAPDQPTQRCLVPVGGWATTPAQVRGAWWSETDTGGLWPGAGGRGLKSVGETARRAGGHVPVAGQGLTPGRPSRRPGGLEDGAARRWGGGGLSRSFRQVRPGGGRQAGKGARTAFQGCRAGAGRAWSAFCSRRPWPLRGGRNAGAPREPGAPGNGRPVLGKGSRVRPQRRLRLGTGGRGGRGSSRPRRAGPVPAGTLLTWLASVPTPSQGAAFLCPETTTGTWATPVPLAAWPA